MSGITILLCLLASLPVFIIVTGWFLYTLGKRSERRKKKKVFRLELYNAPGVRDLIEEDSFDEAIAVYQKFAGVDEYTARDAVERIKRGMDNDT